jgi:signal transduction histidine kinase
MGGGIISGVRDGLQLPTLSARLVDGVLLLAVVAVGVLWAREAWRQNPSLFPALAVVGVFVVILVTGRGRRRDPLPVFVALLVGSLVLFWVSGNAPWETLVLAAVFFVLAYEERPRLRLWLVAVTSLALVLEGLRLEAWTDRIEWVVLVLAVIGWAQGVRASRLYRAGLVKRAEDAERERDLRAAQAVAQERARIARDIHDVVSHSLAVVVVQAAGAERIADKRPDLAKEALGVIAETARGALTEMRALLAVLRDGDGANRAGAPSPGLAQIEELASELSARGLQVRTSTSGTPYNLGAGAELATYRLVQESLTNALKHGGRAEPTTLAIRYDPDALVVHVTNPIPDTARTGGEEAVPLVPGSGTGQIGMRERLALYGGALTTGVEGTHYRVLARIPRTTASGSGAELTLDQRGKP